jgi:phospholipid/cholesterol/gamma-HCH transport system permease protein
LREEKIAAMSELGSYDITVRLRRVGRWLVGAVDGFGEQALFFGQSMRWMPHAVRRYSKETVRLIAEMSLGSGALVLIGGTVGVATFLTLSSGGVIAVQGYASLGNIGIEALTGFLAAFVNVRIAAPVIAGIALAATLGAGTTAQLGAMRIAEEIDAVEAMAIHSVSYLVSTRIAAGMIAIIPLYSLSTLASFFAARSVTVYINGQSSGLYDHYFNTFLNPTDLLWSFLQAIVMAIAVMLIHTYYGFNASGGPAGVGMAVGKAVRASLITVVVITLFISLAVYGASGNFNLSG